MRSFNFLFTILLVFSCFPLFAQYKVTEHQDERKATITMHDYHDPFSVVIKYEEAPHPSGKAAMRAYLRQQKLKAQQLTPATNQPSLIGRSVIPEPEILASFSGNNVITGTPLDNHLAVNTTEQIVSTINTHMLVVNNNGVWQGSYPLDAFYDAVGTSTRFFDPRIIYDPQEDRYIMVLINGSECHESQIVLAFSQTNDPRGDWYLYGLDGCLKDDNTFADYPMIAITENEFFLTYNAVHSDSSWQTGFYGTQIHQINKHSGYNGETLHRKVWQDISYNGKLLRNICPVRNADETLPTSLYLMSDRNFAISNDTVFLLHLTGEVDDAEAALMIEHRITDTPYGVPPYAVQTKDSLDTNDARVLDAFEVGGRIQWVSNTMDFATGRSGVYHGMLTIDDPSKTATGNIIGHPTDYLGYPGIAWTGTDPSQQDAIIVMSHASMVRNPGGSAIYTDGFGQYSDFVTVIEGLRPINMLTGTVERWGDYVGIQRMYNQPGSLWVSMSYGRFSNLNEAWIAKLARAEENTSTSDPLNPVSLKTYPNPTDDYVHIEIDNPAGGRLKVVLYDMNGSIQKILHEGPAEFSGKANIHFSTHALASGEFIVNVLVDEVPVASKKITKL